LIKEQRTTITELCPNCDLILSHHSKKQLLTCALKEQPEIAEKLRPYFELDLSAAATARVTGVGDKTVRRYFKKWVETLRKELGKNWVEHTNTVKARAISMIDMAILGFVDDCRIIEDAIKQFNTDEDRFQARADDKNVVRQRRFPHALFKLKKESRGSITELQLNKAKVELQPTAGENLDQYFKEKYEKFNKLMGIKQQLPSNKI